MKQWRGKIRFHDIGMGAWLLEVKDGTSFPLYGKVPSELQGIEVVVTGEEAEAFGFGMLGDGIAIEVASVVPA